jgi:hemolysin activation/secretion protein
VLGITSAYHYFLSDKSRWFLGVQYHIGQDLAQYEELTVGDITGLRGYPADFQRGNERYLLTIERRYFSNVHIFNLSRLGAVVFFDTGKAWGVDQYGKSLLLSNVGFGLRLSPTKVRIGNVVHIDFAVPTSSKKGADDYQLTIGAYQKF